MARQSMGNLISSLRIQTGMTQKDLADKLQVTEKMVSKWERDLARPAPAVFQNLAKALGASTEELLHATSSVYLINLILRTVPLAMGIAVAVSAALESLTTSHGFAMLGTGLACISLYMLRNDI